VKRFDEQGQRKYLNAVERLAFQRTAERQPREVRTFCLVLYYTGCRLSEALALTPARIDLEDGTLTFESLKLPFSPQDTQKCPRG